MKFNKMTSDLYPRNISFLYQSPIAVINYLNLHRVVTSWVRYIHFIKGDPLLYQNISEKEVFIALVVLTFVEFRLI